jgi:hypothetical protein
VSRTLVALSGLLCCLGSGWLAANTADEGLERTTVSVTRDEDVFRVEAVSRVSAGIDEAWAVLTDYDGYVHFVPGMTLSSIVSESPLLIEQDGEFGVWFFTKRVRATLEVKEDRPSGIFFRAVQGDLRTLDTQVDLASDGEDVSISYHSVIEPDFWVPPLIGEALVRGAIRRKLDAVAREISWRAEFGANR